MSMDFWSARSERYHSRRTSFVRKAKPSSTPLRFASHRREPGMADEEEQDAFDSVDWFVQKSARSLRDDISDRMIRLVDDFRTGADGHARDGDERDRNGGQRVSMRREATVPQIPLRRMVSEASVPQALPTPLPGMFPCYYDP
ncbi:hypothetical protein E4U41_002482 [Claviceps citrina]|nr:hypothetical protein E4U41_002482 [Claviceps citrina]